MTLDLLPTDGLGTYSGVPNQGCGNGNDGGGRASTKTAEAEGEESCADENKRFFREIKPFCGKFVRFNNDGSGLNDEIVESAALRTAANGFASSQHTFSRSISLNTDLDDYVSEDATCRVCNYREKMGRKNRRRPSVDDVVATKKKSKFTKREFVVICLLGLIDFVGFCSMSVMAPFFPREAEKKGLDVSHSGYVFSFYAFVMFVTAPFFGKLIPYVGTKFMFISGVFVNGTCNILFGMLPYIENNTQFEVFCFVVRGFEALGAGAFSTASFIYVIQMFPDNISGVLSVQLIESADEGFAKLSTLLTRRVENLGIMETFAGLGMSIGPAYGGFVFEYGGFPLPFYLLGIFMIMLTPVYYQALPPLSNKSGTRQSGSLLKLVKIPALLIIFLVIVVASNAWSFLDPTLEPHLRQLNLSSRDTGFVFLSFSAFYGIFSPVWGFVGDKFNNHWSIMAVGLLSTATSLVILGPSPLTNIPTTLTINIFALCSLAISVSMVLAPSFKGLLEAAFAQGYPDDLATYSVIAGVWSCGYSLGDMTGPAFGGILLEYFDYPTCTTVMAIFSLAMASVCVFYFGIVGQRKPKVKRPGLHTLLIRDKIAYYGALSNNSDRVNISITTSGAVEV